MMKKEITKLQRQNTSHLEKKNWLRHEISWLTDRLKGLAQVYNQKKIGDFILA